MRRCGSAWRIGGTRVVTVGWTETQKTQWRGVGRPSSDFVLARVLSVESHEAGPLPRVLPFQTKSATLLECSHRCKTPLSTSSEFDTASSPSTSHFACLLALCGCGDGRPKALGRARDRSPHHQLVAARRAGLPASRDPLAPSGRRHTAVALVRSCEAVRGRS